MAKSHKTCMEQAEIIDTFGTYHYCKNKGHWKRNCKKYLGDLKSGLITRGTNKLYQVNRQFHYFTFIGIIDTISIANGSQIGTGNSQNPKEKNE